MLERLAIDVLMTRDKCFYRSFFALFFPLVLQNVINLGVNVADNIMLGAYSEAALSGAAAVNQLQFILQCLVNGVGNGLTVLGSQYWGQKRTEPIRRVASFALVVGTLFSLVIFLLCAFFPNGMMRIFVDDAGVIQEGMEYLAVVKHSYIPFAITSVLLCALNSVETVKLSFWTSVEALVVNIVLNALLIPLHGSWGAAMATLLSRLVTLATVVLYTALGDKKLRLRLKSLFPLDKTLCMDFIRVATPVVIVGGMWGLSNAMQTVILGHMTAAAIAANSASYTLYSLIKAAAISASSVASIVMAKTVGAGDMGKVRENARTLQIMFLIIGVLSALLLYAVQGPVLAFYKLSEDTMVMARQFILVLCVCTVGMGYQMPTISGIIRGGGDTRFGMLNDLVSIWLIVLPVSALAAFVWHWPPVAVVACLNADQIFKCGAAAIRCNGYRWVKKLTRDAVAPENE